MGPLQPFPAAGEGSAWEQEGDRSWPGGWPSGRKDDGLFCVPGSRTADFMSREWVTIELQGGKRPGAGDAVAASPAPTARSAWPLLPPAGAELWDQHQGSRHLPKTWGHCSGPCRSVSPLSLGPRQA